jgi:iron complex outermembrane receptor protein
MTNKHLFLTSAAVVALAGGASETWAQSTTLQEVIVTSQRREQRLQDVPISVSAVTQKAIVANRIENVHDLTAVAPNLTVQESAGGVNLPAFAMRGLQSYGVATGSDKEISIYLDGVYIGSSTGSMFDVADLDRIEVLKGPQGTLFGRNSTGGAISITTRDPVGRFHFHQELTGGNYDQFRSKTRIDTPTWKGLSAAVTYYHSQIRGDVANTGAGTVWDYRPVGYGFQVSPHWLGSHNINAVTAAVKYQPAPNFTLTYKFDWTEDHGTPVGNGLAAVYPAGLGDAAFLLTEALGPTDQLPFAYDRPSAVNNKFDIPNYNEANGHNLTIVWRPSQRVTFKNILAYREADAVASATIAGDNGATVSPTLAFLTEIGVLPPYLDLGTAGSYFAILDPPTVDKTRQWSDEFQVVYDSPWMTLTSGLLYYWSHEATNGIGGSSQEYALQGIPDNLIVPTGVPSSWVTEKSEAFYIQPEFHITKKLDLIVGYRITHDNKENFFSTLPPGESLINISGTYRDTKPSALISLDYKFTPDVMVYGKYSVAYMSGGQSFTLTYNPEIAKSWEGGAKIELFDRRLRANLAVWTVKYTNQQTAVGGASLIPPQPNLDVVVINSGNLNARGFELEGAVIPIDGLTLGYGVGYTREWFTYINPALSPPGAYFQPVERPRMTANINVEYDSKPVWNEAYVVARMDANFRGREYISPYLPTGYSSSDLTPQSVVATSAWVLNARLALSHVTLPVGRAEVALWAHNLLDDRTPEYGVGVSFLESVYWGPPRTFGVDLTYDF